MSEDVKVSALDLEIKQAQLAREKQMLRKAELDNQHLEYQIQQLEGNKERQESDAKSHGQILKANNASERLGFTVCTHKKGGTMLTYPRGDGEHGGYAIIRHRLPSGDIWIRCLRCGIEWLPPIKPVAQDDQFKTAKGFDEPKFKAAFEIYKVRMEDYKKALQFPTDNTDSGSPRFQFKDQEIARRAFVGTNPTED